MNYPKDNTLVQTNIGPAYRYKGAWYIWDLHNGRGSRRKYPNPELFKHWEALVEESWMTLPTAEYFSIRERIGASGMLGMDERMRLPMKVGWFRPIYFYLPIVGSLAAIAICLFLAQKLDSTFYQSVAMLWLPVIAFQLFTAKREYDDWVFNWKLLQVTEEFAAAVAWIGEADWADSWWPDGHSDDDFLASTTGTSV